MKDSSTKKKRKRKETRGGAREGAGAPSKGIETSLINFRIPTTLHEDLKSKFGRTLNRYFIPWAEKMAKEGPPEPITVQISPEEESTDSQ